MVPVTARPHTRPPEAKAKLKELAAADGRKLANYVTRVLESHIEQKERKAHKKSLSSK